MLKTKGACDMLVKCKSECCASATRHTSQRHLQHSEQWILTFCAQMFITSQTYYNSSRDVILGQSGKRYLQWLNDEPLWPSITFFLQTSDTSLVK